MSGRLCCYKQQKQCNILNCWLSLCSKCPPFALTYARRRVRHCLTAVLITRWSSSSKVVRIRERSSSTSLIRPWPHFVIHRISVRPVWRQKRGRNECPDNCLASAVGGRNVLLKVETRKTLTADKHLAEVFASKGLPGIVTTLNYDTRHEMDAGCSESRHRDRHH